MNKRYRVWISLINRLFHSFRKEYSARICFYLRNLSTDSTCDLTHPQAEYSSYSNNYSVSCF